MRTSSWRTPEEAVPADLMRAEDECYVDPRDSLCTAFQLWDRETTVAKERQASILEDLFGPRIRIYFVRCTKTSDHQVRIALCNLACFDVQVINAHYNNKKIIRGRYGTTFSSAFFVKAPIDADGIVSVELLDGQSW